MRYEIINPTPREIGSAVMTTLPNCAGYKSKSCPEII
jgi:hypothetical protein